MFPSLPRSESSNGIAYHRVGSGEPIALLHGVGLCAESWHKQIAVLAEAYTVIAPDMPGHGHSRCFGRTAPQLADYAESVLACLDEISTHRFIIAGHSMGAMIALKIAAAHPKRCKAVASLNGVFDRAQEARDAVQRRAAGLRHNQLDDIARTPIKRWFGDVPSMDERQSAEACTHWLRTVDRRGYETAYSVFATTDGPSLDELTAIRIPTLFLTGDRDLNSTPAMSQAMAAVAPLGESVIVPDAGHMLLLTHATEVNPILRQFCDDVSKRRQ